MPGKSKIVPSCCVNVQVSTWESAIKTELQMNVNSLINGEQRISSALISVEKGVNNVI